MIELKNISKTYVMGEIPVHALREVSLNIGAGEFVAIMGPSGSGKSTLMHILGFLDRADSGEYLVLGRDVSRYSDDELAGLRNHLVGFIFQQFHLLRRVNALDNVSLPFIYSGANINAGDKARQKLVSVGLKERMHHCPNELSGGQQQRVAIARALIKDPPVIFADEPTGNLDTKSQNEIMQILKDLNDGGKTIIMVTHEEEVANYAKRIIRMRDGKIISDERKNGHEKNKSADRSDDFTPAKRSIWEKKELTIHLHQAIRAIMANKVRSFLSMLGILVGVAAVIAMMALGQGATVSIKNQLKSLGSNLLVIRGGSWRFHGAASTGAVARFTPKDIDAIGKLSAVKKISGYVSGNAQLVYLNSNSNSRVEGVDVDYGEMRSTLPSIGRWLAREDIQTRAKVAVIGSTVQENLFGTKNPIGKTIKINRINFRVIGVAQEKGSAGPQDQDDTVYIPVTTAMYRVFGKNYLDGIYTEIITTDQIERAKEQISELIRKRNRLYQDENSFSIRDMSEIQSMMTSTTKTMSILLGSIAAISLFVGGIGIMNIMLVSVTERTREIGLRKAIGARKADIMAQFLIESVVMTLTGGVIGILLGATAAFLLAKIAGWATQVSLFSVILSTTFSAGVGICFGLWPAKKAAELNPVEALRYE
jgi:macrolide transport system ATP-binding/permease protein